MFRGMDTPCFWGMDRYLGAYLNRSYVMKKFLLPAALFSAVSLCGVAFVSCHGGKGSGSDYPADFKSIGDCGRVDYMMKRVSPDSLARFIIYGALGRNPGAPIDTLAIATNYAYEKLKGDDLDSFSVEYDSLVGALPLAEKMRVYKLAASEDPQGLGYKLGLEYMMSIRDGNKSADQVEKELVEFKKACASDTATYRRFIIGFHTVLELDHGKDLSEEIYRRFVNYE